METVQLLCGSCNRVMAISVEHLGTQVHCPHCNAIVQAPPKPSPKPPEIRISSMDQGETESIFASPEVTDDLFEAGPVQALVEMPPEKPAPDSDRGLAPTEIEVCLPRDEKIPNFSLDKAAPGTPVPLAWTTDPGVPPHQEDGANASLAVQPVRRPESTGMASIILLIFLIPYAILATIVIIYLMYSLSQVLNPLERLPDPKPKNGGPRLIEQVKHDEPLPAKLLTKLERAIQIGDIEVLPVKVQETKEGDLALLLKARNLSKNLVFTPISDEFLKFTEQSMTSARPYTFLDWGPKRFYGGFLEFEGAGGEEKLAEDIGPGQEKLIRLITAFQYRKEVPKVVASQKSLVWRVQVRRGFLEVHGQPVSATAVIGVEFSPRAIEKES